VDGGSVRTKSVGATYKANAIGPLEVLTAVAETGLTPKLVVPISAKAPSSVGELLGCN
jgi:hypothetical protein